MVEKGVLLMGKVADPLREQVEATFKIIDLPHFTDIDENLCTELLRIADQIDSEHERRMEQCRHETKRAFAKYLRQITAEYERDHKRKSWVAQNKMQLELDVLKCKSERMGQ